MKDFVVSQNIPFGSGITMDNYSIFDLSPAEKLQLVEDLWDDLSADPSAVPVHDWQLEDWSGERPICETTRLPGCPGMTSKRGYEQIEARLPNCEMSLLN
jgi:hypothetical protein